jgi:hypothetical protein
MSVQTIDVVENAFHGFSLGYVAFVVATMVFFFFFLHVSTL